MRTLSRLPVTPILNVSNSQIAFKLRIFDSNLILTISKTVHNTEL